MRTSEDVRVEMANEIAAAVAALRADDAIKPHSIRTESSEKVAHTASAWRADTNFIIVQHRGVRRTLTFTDTPNR